MDKRSFATGAAFAALATALVTSVAPAIADFRRSERVIVDRDAFVIEIGDLARDADGLERAASRMGRPHLARRAAALEARLGGLAESVSQAPALDDRRDRDRDRDRDRRRAMSDADFEQLADGVDRTMFGNDKIDLIGRAAASNWFTTGQAAALADRFMFSSDKLEVLARVWPRLSDEENAWKLWEKLPLASDRDKLKARLGR